MVEVVVRQPARLGARVRARRTSPPRAGRATHPLSSGVEPCMVSVESRLSRFSRILPAKREESVTSICTVSSRTKRPCAVASSSRSAPTLFREAFGYETTQFPPATTSRRRSRCRSSCAGGGYASSSCAGASCPSWVKDPKDFPPRHQRPLRDGLLEKPTFKAAMKRRRCVFVRGRLLRVRREAGRRRPT